MIVLISAHSVDKSGFVQNETREALEVANSHPPGKIFVIPVRLDPTIPKYEPLLKLHWVDLFPDYLLGLSRILSSLNVKVTTGKGSVEPLLPVQSGHTDADSGVTLDDQALRVFLRTNGLSLYLDREIASFTVKPVIWQLSSVDLSNDVAGLGVAGIQSIAQLERALRKYRTAILSWAGEWLIGSNTQISEGSYLKYLGYILICQTDDSARLRQFLEAANIDFAERREAIVIEVMKAYRQLVGDTV